MKIKISYNTFLNLTKKSGLEDPLIAYHLLLNYRLSVNLLTDMTVAAKMATGNDVEGWLLQTI